jgi:mannitol/fructose-specific phosphotransferase system IIA component (Ntr-type)
MSNQNLQNSSRSSKLKNLIGRFYTPLKASKTEAISENKHSLPDNNSELPGFSSEKYFIPELGTTDKNEAVQKLCEILKVHPGMLNYNKFCKEVFKREILKNTIIGNNLAIPHSRNGCVNQLMIAAGKSNEGIKFGPGENECAHYVILIGAPAENIKEYLKLLANIAQLFRNDSERRTLLQAQSAKEISLIFKSHLESKT